MLDENNQALDCIQPILFLSAVAFRFDEKDTRIRHTITSQYDQPLFYIGSERSMYRLHPIAAGPQSQPY